MGATRKWRRRVEKRRRKEEAMALRAEFRSIEGRSVPIFVGEDCSPEDLEESWRRVVAFETAPPTTDRRRLARLGLEFPDPEGMPEPEVARRLAGLIAGLAELSVYLLHTDHLSDRELYAELVRHAIDVETRDVPGHFIVLDLLDHWVGRNEETYLRYYATPAERRDARILSPDQAIPPAQDRPYDRDRTLPWPVADGETGPGPMTFRRVRSVRSFLEALAMPSFGELSN